MLTTKNKIGKQNLKKKQKKKLVYLPTFLKIRSISKIRGGKNVNLSQIYKITKFSFYE